MLWLRKNALAVASIVPFGAAIYLAIIDRTASATLMAGLFVVSVVLHYFPELEVLKAFSIEAHLKKRINEAEQLLEQIQNSALVSAQNTYLYLSWGQRLGSPSFKMKGDLIAETSKLLRSLHIPEEQVTSLERPFFQFMAFDLASRFQMLLLDRVVVYEMKALAEATKQYPLHLEESDRKQAELKAVFNDAREKLKGGRSKPDDKELLQLEFHLKRLIPTDLFSAEDQRRLVGLAETLGQYHSEALTNGVPSEGTVSFMDNFSGNEGRKQFYEETFGERSLLS